MLFEKIMYFCVRKAASRESPLNKGGSEGVWKYRWLRIIRQSPNLPVVLSELQCKDTTFRICHSRFLTVSHGFSLIFMSFSEDEPGWMIFMFV